MRIIRFPRLKKTSKLNILGRIDEIENDVIDNKIDIGALRENFDVLLGMYDEYLKTQKIPIEIYYCKNPRCPGYVFKASDIGHPTNTCYDKSDPIMHLNDRTSYVMCADVGEVVKNTRID